MKRLQPISHINPIKLALVVMLFLSFGHFERGISFFYFAPAIILLTLMSLNKYAVRNKFIILAFLLSALIPIPIQSLGIDIARDVIFIFYFFAAIILGHSLARYMHLEYLIYGLFFAGAYVTFLTIVKLIMGFQGEFSLIAIREITGGAGDLGIVFIVLSFYGRRSLFLKIIFFMSLFLMLFTQSRTMLASFLLWGYFFISSRSGIFLNWVIASVALLLISLLIILGASADSESYTFLGKMLRSFQEIVPNEDQNIHSNWRAVESAVALNSFINGSLFEILFGNGLGFRLSLGFEMTLADVKFDSIPILHNGYLYILLKYGIFGLFLWYKILSSLVQKAGDPELVTISKSCFYIILVIQVFSSGVLQYTTLIFLLIMAACATLNSNNA